MRLFQTPSSGLWLVIAAAVLLGNPSCAWAQAKPDKTAAAVQNTGAKTTPPGEEASAPPGDAKPQPAPTAKPPAPEPPKPTPPPSSTDPAKPLSGLPGSRVVIVIGIIGLMAGLFWALLRWQQQTENAGYLAVIFKETIRDIEKARRAEPFTKRWQSNAYLEDLLLGRAPDAENWHRDNPKPAPEAIKGQGPASLVDMAQALKSTWKIDLIGKIDLIQRRMDTPPFVSIRREGGGTNPFDTRWDRPGVSGSGIGGLGSSFNLRPGFNDEPAHDPARQKAELDARAAREAVEALLKDFGEEVDKWLAKADNEAHKRYQSDLNAVENTATAQADRALGVDFSQLRGRGPEFVLEFTAVVVIIFAAVILAVLERLDSNQVGTLLAAIAGYVLGKSTSQVRAGETGKGELAIKLTQVPAGTGTEAKVGKGAAQ